MTGTADTATAAPPAIDRTVEHDSAFVTINISSPDVLTMLARAITRDEDLSRAFAYLGLSPFGPRRLAALETLLGSPAVRDALTVTLTQGDAQDLADDIVAAAEDLTCEGLGDRGYCTNQALDDTWLRCPECTDAEEKLATAKVRHLTACEDDE